MKRLFAILICLALAAGLCACGTDNPTPVAAPTPEPATDTDAQAADTPEPASVSNAAAIEELPPIPASDTDAAPDAAAYEAAQGYVGRPVGELYAELGEPSEAQYAASCEQEDAEDGMLFYDGFYIWTVRTETEELVRAVYLMD